MTSSLISLRLPTLTKSHFNTSITAVTLDNSPRVLRCAKVPPSFDGGSLENLWDFTLQKITCINPLKILQCNTPNCTYDSSDKITVKNSTTGSLESDIGSITLYDATVFGDVTSFEPASISSSEIHGAVFSATPKNGCLQIQDATIKTLFLRNLKLLPDDSISVEEAKHQIDLTGNTIIETIVYSGSLQIKKGPNVFVRNTQKSSPNELLEKEFPNDSFEK